MSSYPPNPFAGPRPLTLADEIFGRDTEKRELYWTFSAERILWFHGPSASGKTSLLHAGLIPKLEADRFDILPIVRLNIAPPSAPNPFLESLRLSIGATGDLSDFLIPPNTTTSRVLIFDQFEELLSLYPAATGARETFCKELGQLLTSPRLWALFVVREDCLAAFNPISRLIPTGMNQRFRLGPLSVSNAVTAMTEISKKGGRKFQPDETRTLVEFLSEVRDPVSGKPIPGDSVEPVYLQIVCHSVWSRLSRGEPIPAEPSKRRTYLESAIGAFYEECLRDFEKPLSLQRDVRDWIGNTLIVNGARGIVLESDLGIPTSWVATLLSANLIRHQSGARPWYELAHDLLINPILENNRKWAEDVLLKFQLSAIVWKSAGKPDALLLSDSELAGAESDLRKHQPVLRPEETDFINRSRSAAAARRNLRLLHRAIAILAVAMSIAAFIAYVSYLRADAHAKLLESQNIPQQQPRAKEAIRLARHSLDRLSWLDAPLRRDSIQILNQALQRPGPFISADNTENPAEHILSLPEYVVSAFRNRVRIREESTLLPSAGKPETWRPDCGACINDVAPAPDLKSIWVALSNGELHRVAIPAAEDILPPSTVPATKVPTPSAPAAQALAVSPKGRIAIADDNRRLLLDGVTLTTGNLVKSLAFSPNGDRLAAGMSDGSVRIFRTGQSQYPSQYHTLTTSHGKPITALAWGPGGLLAGGKEAPEILLWDDLGQFLCAFPSKGGVTAVAMSPDGKRVAAIGATNNGQTFVWPADGGSPLILTPPPADSRNLESLAFRGNDHLLTGDKSGDIRLFYLTPDALRRAANARLNQP